MINRKLKSLILFVGVLFLSSCSTVRVKYEATVVDDYFKTAQFEFYESFEITDLQKRCLWTAIFFGGACWAYLNEPQEDIQRQINQNARQKIEEVFGPNNFEHRNIQITRFGWNDLPTDYQFPSGSPLRNNYQFHHQEPEQRYPSPAQSRPRGIGEN